MGCRVVVLEVRSVKAVAMLNCFMEAYGAGLSRAWVETAKREKWNANFGINLLDDWAEQLVEVAQEEVD